MISLLSTTKMAALTFWRQFLGVWTEESWTATQNISKSAKMDYEIQYSMDSIFDRFMSSLQRNKYVQSYIIYIFLSSSIIIVSLIKNNKFRSMKIVLDNELVTKSIFFLRWTKTVITQLIYQFIETKAVCFICYVYSR